MTPYASGEQWELYRGDCVDAMQALPSGSIDAIVTDPPYCSGARTAAAITNRGGMQRGARWNAKPLDSDQMTATGFIWLMRMVARESLRLLKPGGWFVSFIDWRQYPILFGALESCNLRICNMLVWDKQVYALGNGFRNQHELAIVASKGVGVPHDRSTGNVLSVPRLRSSTLHPTEKPIALFAPILRVVAPPAGVVLDPFTGSGSVGAACAETGRRFIGMEREAEYLEIAARRLSATLPDRLAA